MTRIEVRLPTPLRGFVGGRPTVAAEGVDVGEVLQWLAQEHPGLERHLFTPQGALRSFVTLYLNDEDVRSLEKDRTPVKEGDVLSIVPAIAGGAPSDSAPSVPPTRGLGAGAELPLSRDELRRYSRHLLLPEVGVAGQKRLKRSKVLLVGAGGLGAPASLYLAAAGVGEIGLVDFDRVEVSNLQRQVLYGSSDVGRPKLAAAAERLADLNPGVRVTPHEGRLTSANALDILGQYDVVIDGTDNFPTRYLVNDACVLLGKPNVYGSIYRFEGQASVFDASRGPCYRCLYAEPPPPGLVPSCAEGGVLGALPGIIGTIQAVETVKLLLGVGEPLIGRLLLFDALAMQFRELTLRKNPDCSLCGPRATQKGLIDYQAFCGVGADDAEGSGPQVPEITPQELRERLRETSPLLLVDVREPHEWEIAHLPEATLIPRGELPERLSELTRAPELVLYCKSGGRSAHATRFLLDIGFTNVRHLRGGIDAWAREVDPSLPQY